MIYRSAMPDDGAEMLRLIESHPVNGGMQILYTRRPDAYRSYIAECGDAEMTLCVDDDNRILAQVSCLPRKLYINKQVQTVGYVTGLHKMNGTSVNLMKMLEEGHKRSSVKQFFCSILDENRPAYDLFARRGLLYNICDYTTYLFYPAAFKPLKHGFRFRRAGSKDTERILSFYNEVGAEYSYFPYFETMNVFTGLSISDFFLFEKDDKIIAACALWSQQSYKQYIAVDYRGAYKLASKCNPLLRLLRYPQLPKKNTAANFAYISFLLCRKDSIDVTHAFLGDIASAACGHGYDFLTIGTEKPNEMERTLNAIKSIKFGSKLCAIDWNKSGSAPVHQTPFRFECALL